MVEAADPGPICSVRKAISAFFPYAILRDQRGQPKALDLILRAARASEQSGFMWHCVEPFATTLLHEESPISSKRASILALPHISWRKLTNSEHLIQLWVVATSAVLYTDEIGQAVVDTLLLVASLDSLSPRIPVDMWLWLSKRPPLHPNCLGRHCGANRRVVQMIRALEDVEILKSYLPLVWSEWDNLRTSGFLEMCTSLQEDFNGGTGMDGHRQDLLRHLDHIVGELDLGLEHLRRRKPTFSEAGFQLMKRQYGALRQALLEVSVQKPDL